MELIGHRGLWCESLEKNSIRALKKCFEHGFGTETDVRDCFGKLVISHDAPLTDTNVGVTDLLENYLTTGCPGTLAFNIKSDGLADRLLKTLWDYRIENYVVFDMSIPDLLSYRDRGARYLVRVSEYEPLCFELLSDSGIWLDGFRSDWYVGAAFDSLLKIGVPLYVVSSELHRRDPTPLWKYLNDYRDERVILCTDRPKDAAEVFFGE